MRVKSLGFQTDLALRVLEGAEVTDRGDYLVVRSPGNPTFYWGNFLLLAGWPEPGTGDAWLARFAAEFPQAEHVALGVDAMREPAEISPEFLAAGLEFERATVLTCAAVQPPPHQNTDAGADEARVRAVLAGDEYADAVRADFEEARMLGASGVPFFVIDRKYGVSGAQPAETFLHALRTAYAAEDAQDATAL